jgi:hypothetical protein
MGGIRYDASSVLLHTASIAKMARLFASSDETDRDSSGLAVTASLVLQAAGKDEHGGTCEDAKCRYR